MMTTLSQYNDDGYINRFHDPIRRHSTLGYLTPTDFKKQAVLA